MNQQPRDRGVAIREHGNVTPGVVVAATTQFGIAEQMHDRKASTDAFSGRQTVGAHTPVSMRGLDKQVRCLVAESPVFLQETGITDAAENLADFGFGFPLEHVFPSRVEFLERLA